MDWFNQNFLRWFPSPSLTCLFCVLISTTCLLGDHLLFLLSGHQENGNVLRAITDSATHASVGALVWAVVENSELFTDNRKLLSCLFCGLLAALVDVDHFLAAKSIDLNKALHLKVRPPFHNTSIVLLAAFVIWTIGYYRPAFKIFSLMFLASWMSHHIRDGNHRGLWLAPFGQTPVLSRHLYIFLVIILALTVRIWSSQLHTHNNVALDNISIGI